MVLTSSPVLSDRRLAVRPVGAQRANATRLAPITFRTELTSVVLPTPGPPVMTSTFDRSAVGVRPKPPCSACG